VFGAALAEGLDPFPPTAADEIDDERRTAETVMSYWANFIRTGFEFIVVILLCVKNADTIAAIYYSEL